MSPALKSATVVSTCVVKGRAARCDWYLCWVSSGGCGGGECAPSNWHCGSVVGAVRSVVGGCFEGGGRERCGEDGALRGVGAGRIAE